jgi:hypothetical protein
MAKRMNNTESLIDDQGTQEDDVEDDVEDGGDANCKILVVPGTNFGLKTYRVGVNKTIYYEVMELRDVEMREKSNGTWSKTGETKQKFIGGIYPSTLFHAAQIIANKSGFPADTLPEILQNIINERVKLEKVLLQLIKAELYAHMEGGQ